MSKQETKQAILSKFRTVLQNILGNVAVYNVMSNNMLRLKLFTLEIHFEKHTNY